VRARFTPILVAILAAGALIGAAPVSARQPIGDPKPVGRPADDGAAARGGPPAAAAEKPGRRLKTLEDAVSAGILDPSVLKKLRSDGVAEAALSFASDDIAAAAHVGAKPGKQQVKDTIEAMGRGYAAQRERVLKKVGKGVTVITTYEYLDVADIRITDERSLLALVNQGDVEGVTGPQLAPATLQQSLTTIGQPAVKAAGHEGQGTYVAVLDTGVNTAIGPTFFPAGSIQASLDAAPNDGAADDHGHGTHVASTVLGVAPKTKLFVYDVFQKAAWSNCDPVGSICNLSPDTAQRAAIQDVLNKKGAGWNIVAVSMSLGGGWFNAGCTDSLSFGTLRAVGILPVVASGNYFHHPKTRAVTTGISSPSCIPAAVAVGSSNDDASRSASWDLNRCDSSLGVDSISIFSQTTAATNATYGPLLDILAPGSCIRAAGGNMQGTSMATPHVSGAVAVLKGSWTFANTAAGALNVESYLESYGKQLYDARTGAPAQYRPRLNLAATVAALSGTADATPPVVNPIGTEMVATSQLSASGQVLTRLRWGASDASGLKSYTLWWRVNAGTWNQQTLPNALTATWDYLLAPNDTWEFAVNATDSHNNTSDFKFALVRYLIFQESSPATVYSPLANWSIANRADCLGGAMRVASATASRAVFTFQNAKQVAWVATTNVDRGHAYRWVDGRGVGWLDLYSATIRRRVAVTVFAVANYTAQHTIELYVNGTAGRPYVDIDAWVLMQDR
jgi:hypothetical protein